MVPPEIIDLTEGEASPPPPSRFSDGPTILNFAMVDPVLSDFQNHATTTSVWPPSMHIYDPSANPSYYHYQGSNNNSSSFFFQPYMHAHHHQPDCLTADWTLRDHELFLMGLSNYGRGRWNKIARHYLHNKTPQQVQSYANRFFSHQPPSPPPSSSTQHFYNFRIRNPSSSSTYPSSGDEPIKKTLMLFPEKKEHNEMFATRETATNTTNTAANNYEYGLLFGIIPTTTTIGASSSSFMSGSGNYYEEIDLELRLGSS